MDQASSAVDLGVQLGFSALMVLIMTMVHSIGLVTISRILRLEKDRLLEHKFDMGAVLLLGAFGMMLFAIHMVEIAIFAGFYLAVGAIPTLEDALYYSATAYATLGWSADYFPEDWRLIGAMEALIGFILIGWSTAFMVTTMRRLTE